MDGIISLNKPVGISSARALDRVRAITRQRRSGHAGTLDPAADGVLIICLGRATKLVEAMMDLRKEYRVAARLDVTSESYDSDRPLIPVDVGTPPARSDVAAALRRFEGELQQTPPAVSALKVGGRRAYALVRAGITPALAPRTVRIYELVLHDYHWPALTFSMSCGRGAYVRSVVRDLGATLATGGCLTALTRTAVGPFDVQDSWTIERLAAASMEEYLIPLERARELIAAP